MKKIKFVWQMGVGGCALTCWLVLFCGGLLLETVEYRAFLAPHSFPHHAKANKDAEITTKAYDGSVVFAFVASALWFSPTNMAFLALTAGLLGGCASNVLAEDLSPEQAEQIHPESWRYLTEAPWSAMLRSFIVYLCVIAGLYFAMDDPFKDSTPAQYMRLAGTISVLSLLVGYDPTRIRSWIGMVPTPQSQKITVTDIQKHVLEVKTDQAAGADLHVNDAPPESSSMPVVSVNVGNGESKSDQRARRSKPR